MPYDCHGHWLRQMPWICDSAQLIRPLASRRGASSSRHAALAVRISWRTLELPQVYDLKEFLQRPTPQPGVTRRQASVARRVVCSHTPSNVGACGWQTGRRGPVWASA
jgi:hypothetical protein